MTADEADQILRTACPGAGGCGIAASFNTWGIACEALGIMLPDSSSIPAEGQPKHDECKLVGAALRNILEQDIRPRDILTKTAFANATRAIAAAGGSTNGGQGIELAYQTAVAHFITGGINRVILATDGDFNVGVTSDGDLTRLIEERAKSAVFLSVLGFGEGNLQDAKMEGLADKGNGNYAYIDTLAEARKVFVEQLDGTLPVTDAALSAGIAHAYLRARMERRIVDREKLGPEQRLVPGKQGMQDLSEGEEISP